MISFKIINGPNLNMLGTREREIYGDLSLPEIQEITEKKCKNFSVQLDWLQSNNEGEMVSAIQSCQTVDYLIINPGAYAHTSLAVYDALKTLKIPIVEVHLTNIHAREAIRSRLLTGKAVEAIISGLGQDSYYIAVLSCLLRKENLCIKPQTLEKI